VHCDAKGCKYGRENGVFTKSSKFKSFKEVIMCQSNAFLVKENGTEEIVMEDVSFITPTEDGYLELTGLFGDRLTLNASIKEMDLLKHKILIQEN